MSNCPGWTKWRPGSKCSFSCLVPARGLQMVTRRFLKPKEMCSKKTLKQMRSKKYSNIGPLGVCQANAKGSRPLFKSVKTPAQGLFNVNVKLQHEAFYKVSMSGMLWRTQMVEFMTTIFSHTFWRLSKDFVWPGAENWWHRFSLPARRARPFRWHKVDEN